MGVYDASIIIASILLYNSKDMFVNQSEANPPLDYEEKFAGFIEICSNAKQDNTPNGIIAHPRVLGDTYEEVIESLSRLAEAKLSLYITSR